MYMKKLFMFLLVTLLLVGSVAATGLSIQLKRTNPGIAGKKSAELIFDIVNTDFNYKVEGFLWCRSPDDAVISSTMGVGTGSGAQYVSQRFYVDSGPSQKSMSLTINADTPGDKRTGCTVKYAPYKEIGSGEEAITVEVNYEGTIGLTETDISGFKVKMLSFTPEDEETAAKAEISVNDIPKSIVVGDSAMIGGLIVELLAATNNSAEVDISGTITDTTTTESIKQYLKMNGELTSSLTDSEYREIRLDKTIPFVSASANGKVKCPKGKTTCNANEVELSMGGRTTNIPIWTIILGFMLVILSIPYLLGKTTR